MAEILVCRGCHVELTKDYGCPLCLPVKPHLTVKSAVDEDAAPLAETAQDIIGVLRSQTKQLKIMQKHTAGFDPLVASETRHLAAAIAKVLDSARKLVEDGADAVDSMSFAEKIDLFRSWFVDLPSAMRNRVLDVLGNVEAKAPAIEEPSHDESAVH